MARPFAGAQLVADQPVGGLSVGDPQQRLGEAHQHDAFPGAQLVFVEERFDPELIAAGAPDPPGQLERTRPDAGFGALVDRGELE